MKATEYITVDGREVPIGDERNLLELVRKAGVRLQPVHRRDRG